jgi:hypothetical protein
MNEAWQEWDIRWALEGIATVAGYVGVPKAQVLVPPGPTEPYYGINTEFPEDNNVLFTSTTDGTTTTRRIRASKASLSAGPVRLEQVDAACEERALVWPRSMPCGGVHKTTAAPSGSGGRLPRRRSPRGSQPAGPAGGPNGSPIASKNTWGCQALMSTCRSGPCRTFGGAAA